VSEHEQREHQLAEAEGRAERADARSEQRKRGQRPERDARAHRERLVVDGVVEVVEVVANHATTASASPLPVDILGAHALILGLPKLMHVGLGCEPK
jgi:hypothetical protein